jgi:hypothetical protein
MAMASECFASRLVVALDLGAPSQLPLDAAYRSLNNRRPLDPLAAIADRLFIRVSPV